MTNKIDGAKVFLPNNLYIEGYFMPAFRNVPDNIHKVYETSRTIEEIVRNSFQLPTKTYAVEIPVITPKEDGVRGYSAMVYVSSGSKVVAWIGMELYNMIPSLLPWGLHFQAVLPIVYCEMESKNAVEQMWSIVRGIEYFDPQIMGIRVEICADKFQKQSIILTKNSTVVATGYPALEDLRLKLPKKPILLSGLG